MSNLRSGELAGRRWSRRVSVLVACGCAAGSGCESARWSKPSDYGMKPTESRVREVTPLNEARFRSEVTAPARADALRSPFEGMERVEVTLEQARAWTLENNLDLRVALIDPVIANESVTEEEGRFNTVIFSRAQYNDISQPSASQLEGTKIRQFTFEPGVRIPLRTGGTATVALPVDWTETNNQFSTLNPAANTDLRISLSQPLLRNAGRRTATHGIRIAALGREISKARTKLTVIRTLAAVERAYWRLYAAQRALEVEQMQYELATEQLDRAQRRVNAGQAPEVDVVRAQAGVADRLEGIIIAENLVRQRMRDFKKIVNVPGLEIDSKTLVVTSSEPDPVRFDFDGRALALDALTERMEMLELELQLAQDESGIAFQKNQALPLFTVDYTYRLNGLDGNIAGALRELKNENFDDHLLGVSLEIPITNETARARVQRAILTRLQRLSTKEARELAIRQEVLDAVDAVEAAWQRILASRQSAALNGRTLEGEQRQFDVGARTSTDVLDASTSLATAQLSEIRALTDYQIALVDLAFATGTLLGASRVSWEPYDPRVTASPVTDEQTAAQAGSRSAAEPDAAEPDAVAP